MAKKRTALDQQESIAFGYHECLDAIVRDLGSIDKLIPSESSRSIYGFLDDPKRNMNAILLIESRKNDLLRYIQTMCRDHIEFGKRELDAGWTIRQRNRHKGRRP